jgi:hypothetical protein
MKNAAENGDSEALSGYVDYPALRESLKATVYASMAKIVVSGKKGDSLEGLGSSLAAAFIVPMMINALVTPESLSLLMKGKKPILDEFVKRTKRKSQPKTEEKHSRTKIEDIKRKKEEENTETSMSYKSFNIFVVKVKNDRFSEEPVELVFRRDGLISWKLSGLRLPL